MKTHTSLGTLVLILVATATGLSAQSCAATNNFAAASAHAGNASRELVASGAASVAGSVQAGAAVVAVPVWMSGAAVTGSGAVAAAVGDGVQHIGDGVQTGATKLWDFANGDATQRPGLDREHAMMPPATVAEPAKPLTPAEAAKRL